MESLRRMRREKGLSQQELADLADVGQDSISAIETGKHEPHPRTLRKLAKALGIEVRTFFEEPTLAGKAEAPQVGGDVPNSLEELLERQGANTRHLANEDLAATLAQRPIEDVLQILREISEELEAISPVLTRLSQLRSNSKAMRLFAEATRQSWIARLALPARHGQEFVQVWPEASPELEAEIDETARKLEESRAMAGVG